MSPLRSPRRAGLGAVAAGSALGVVLFAGSSSTPKPAPPQLASQAQLVTVSNPRTSVTATDIAKVARKTPRHAPTKAALKRFSRPTPKRQEIRSRQLAVEFDKAASAADRAALRAQYGVSSHERVTASVERWHLPDAGTERTTAKRLSSEPGVAVATANHVYTLSSADTRFGEQWALEQANDHDVDAPEAWAATDASVTSSVTVAVVDTGVDIDHPDLANQLWRNPGEYGPDGRGGRKESNGIDDDFDGAVDNLRGINAIDPAQSVKPSTAAAAYHGTHVSGIIAAERGNNQGIAGVSKQARIMAVKSFDGRTGDDTSIIAGIDYAIRKGAKIINGSFGGWTDDAGASSNLLTSIISQNPDVLFVFAAGNDGAQTAPGGLRSYPCSAPADNVVCVGATDADDRRASFSNWGADVDLTAPGDRILSTMPGNAYATLSGTSMATPMAAGAAALLKAQTPSLTPVQLKTRLASTADATGRIDDGLAGRFNLDNAVANRTPALPTATATARVQSNALFYDAAAGGANKVQVTSSGTQSYDIVDRGAKVTPGTGCTALSPISVRCTGVKTNALINLGDLADRIYAPVPLSQSINVGAGGSQISVGSGNTGITGGDGDDMIVTGDGRNSITTGAGDDFVHSGAGNDSIDVGDGWNIVSSEAGDDEIRGGADYDWILDGAGSDRVYGGGFGDAFWVGAGGSEQGYGADYDVIDGGGGDDVFSPALSPYVWGLPGAGASYSGGAGIDRLSYGDWGAAEQVTAQIGTKTGNGFGGKDAIGSDIEVLQGSEGDDVLTGSDAADVLMGGRGNDKVDGRGGDDLLDEDGDTSGATDVFGSDQLIGGTGNDTVDYSRPSLSAAVNVNGAITASLDSTRNDGATARGENDLIAGDVEGITGGPLADTLRAGSYAAVLEGGAGADTLVGGPLADSIYAQDAVNDTITCGGGSDFVRKDAAEGANADCETTTGAPLVRITGSLPAGGFTSDRQPAVAFTVAGGPDVTSVCRVLNSAGQVVGTFGTCTSGWRPSAPLADGKYAFVVTSTSSTAGSSAAQREFTVDTVAPDTTLVSGPEEWHESDQATFTLGSTEPKVTYECKLDDEKWRRCESVETYTDLANGSHEFQARATDAADNRDATVLSYDFISYVDAPQTKLTKSPATPTALTSATFEFTAEPTSSTFECKLDAGAWAACTSPKTVTGLSNASHTFSVRAVSFGTADPTPATSTWTVDPAVEPEITVQALSSYGVYGFGLGIPVAEFNTTQPQFALTSDQPNVTYECAVNSEDSGNSDPVFTPCTSPWTSPAQSPTAMVGYHFRVKNAAGATASASYLASFDVEAPTTTLSGGPAEGENTAEPKQQFRFTGTDNQAIGRFQCKIDAGAWTTCSSPFVTPALTVGPHTVEVRTRDRAGNVDATPERRAFNVVAPVAPNTEWVGGASTGSRVSDLSPTLQFKATPSGGRFECAAGPTTSATFAPCTSPWTVPQQQDGTWTVFQVRAIGPTGLVDASPAMRAYLFDGTAPDTTITAGPAAGSTIPTTSTSLSFSANDTTATFECKLDAATWAACTSPKGLTGLTSGAHTFSVRAKDTAGNIDETPATRTFTVTPSQLLTVGNPVAGSASAALTSDASLGTAVDWIHWKGVAPTDVDRKSGTAIIPSWVNYAGNTHAKYALTGSTTFSWTNATGTASGNSALGVSGGAANGRGFTLAVPATNADTRKLKLWLGVRGSTTTGALRVKFNGQTVVAKQFAGNSNTTPVDRTVTIDYRPLTATDTLSVSWYQGGGNLSSASQVVLYAAALY